MAESCRCNVQHESAPSFNDVRTPIEASVFPTDTIMSQRNVTLPWDLLDFPDTPTPVTEWSLTDDQAREDGPVELSLMKEMFSNNLKAENASETTTLCSLALSLVFKNNTKGYSIAELDLKLRKGYQPGATLSEGCRVDNTVLFRVLADIS
jgi:hypothetical protein